MKWDATISLGNVVTMLAFVVTLYTLHIQNVKMIVRIETKVDTMWRAFVKKLAPENIA